MSGVWWFQSIFFNGRLLQRSTEIALHLQIGRMQHPLGHIMVQAEFPFRPPEQTVCGIAGFYWLIT
jgi:hypothetical protein